MTTAFRERTRRVAVVMTVLVLAARAGGQEDLSLPEGVTPDAIRGASTPEEHRAIGDAYAREAEALRAQADDHRHMPYPSTGAFASRRFGADDRRTVTEPSNLAYHCHALTQKLDEAARAADALAQAHRMMAGRVRPGGAPPKSPERGGGEAR